jgi:hypothetical protein
MDKAVSNQVVSWSCLLYYFSIQLYIRTSLRAYHYLLDKSILHIDYGLFYQWRGPSKVRAYRYVALLHRYLRPRIRRKE